MNGTDRGDTYGGNMPASNMHGGVGVGSGGFWGNNNGHFTARENSIRAYSLRSIKALFFISSIQFLSAF